MSRSDPRTRSFDPSSAMGLLAEIGTGGAIFERNAACTTESAKLNAALVQQAVIPTSGAMLVESTRLDIRDHPEVFNRDRHRIFSTGSGWFIVDEKFRGPGHWLQSLPNSPGYHYFPNVSTSAPLITAQHSRDQWHAFPPVS